MSKNDELTEADKAQLREDAKAAHKRLGEALGGDQDLVLLATGVSQNFTDMAIHTGEMLSGLLGHEKADAVVLAAMREAPYTFEAGCRYADRKTKS